MKNFMGTQKRVSLTRKKKPKLCYVDLCFIQEYLFCLDNVLLEGRSLRMTISQKLIINFFETN